MKLIDKDALVAEIDRLDEFYHLSKGASGQAFIESLLSFIDTLEVIDPYEQYIQYASIESGIKAHAEDYSFNIESELFNQLTKEQQALWRKEIEQACISGGYNGLDLAKDPRYKENTEVKEVDLEKEIKDYLYNQPIVTRCKGIDYKLVPSAEKIAKHFFELGLAASNPLTVKDIENIYHLVNKVADDIGIKAMYINIYQETLKRFKAQKGEEV